MGERIIMKEFIKYLTFTKNETKVIIFTISILLSGFALKYYKQVISNESVKAYDFSKDDSVFRERSAGIDKIKSSVVDSDSSDKKEDSLINKLEATEDSLQKKEKLSKANDISYFKNEILNINTATKEELIDLPGIGEATAEKIISFREQKKGFKKIEELMNVKGIGKKKFENIKNYIKAE